jgi:hypothetical protein
MYLFLIYLSLEIKAWDSLNQVALTKNKQTKKPLSIEKTQATNPYALNN